MAEVQEIPVVTRPVDWRDGAARRGELEMLRAEVREVRDLARAVLLVLVGEERLHAWGVEGAIAGDHLRERIGTPLRDLGVVGGKAYDELHFRHDILTLQELVKELTREQVAAIPGLGPARMRRLDEALVEHGLAWVTKASPADGESARVTHLRAVEEVAA
jgi:hypothetical protein